MGRGRATPWIPARHSARPGSARQAAAVGARRAATHFAEGRLAVAVLFVAPVVSGADWRAAGAGPSTIASAC